MDGTHAGASHGALSGSLRRLAVTPALVGFVALPRARANPHPAYRALRKMDPVHRSPLGAWVFSRHRDVVDCLRNGTLSVDERSLDLEWLRSRRLTRMLFHPSSGEQKSASRELMERLMLFSDPPDHTRLRSLVSKAFTPRAVAAIEPRVRDILDELLEKLVSKGSMEIMSELAYPLPAKVICEMLGVPADEHPLIVAHAPIVARRLDPIMSPEVIAVCDRSTQELTVYIEDLIERRRKDPGDDLLSALMAAQDEGASLSHDELVATVILLLIAGHETTANLLGNALLALLRNPRALQQFREDANLDHSAIEEFLRFDGPIQLTQRITVEPLSVAGEMIPAGRMIILCLSAANRDPEVFERPNSLDLARNPNPHLAFSAGGHFCLGAALARLEARIALRTLVDRLDGMEVVGPVRWRSNFTIRGLQALQLRW